jgi:membrane protease YdiL (CAAX protease family)
VSTFTIEGRQAPALFVVGWLASILGLGTIVIAALAGGTTAATILLLGGCVVLVVGLIALAGSQGIERRARGGLAYAGPSPVLVFATVIPISLVLGVFIGLGLSFLGIPRDGPLAAFASIVALGVVYAGLVRLLVVDTGALSWADMGWRVFDRAAVRECIGGAAWAVPMVIATTIVSAILLQIFPVEATGPLPPTGETVGLVLNLITGALLAPVFEELFFRGFATTAWARSVGRSRAIVGGALFFAVVHILNVAAGEWDDAVGMVIVQFASRIPIAIALGWLFLRRGSIWAPIGLHAAFNGILLILSEVALRSELVP